MVECVDRWALAVWGFIHSAGVVIERSLYVESDVNRLFNYSLFQPLVARCNLFISWTIQYSVQGFTTAVACSIKTCTSTCIRIITFKYCSWFVYVIHCIVAETTATSPVTLITTNRVLFWKFVQKTRFYCISGFYCSNWWECPTWTTISLILNLLNNIHVSPVHLSSVICERWHHS